MTDMFDHASEREQLDREQALETQRLRAAEEVKNRPAAAGYCLTCFEDFPANDNNRLFCDAKCAQAYK